MKLLENLFELRRAGVKRKFEQFVSFVIFGNSKIFNKFLSQCNNIHRALKMQNVNFELAESKLSGSLSIPVKS